MGWLQILQVIVVQGVFFGVIIFFLRRIMLSSTDSAVKRLNSETEAVRAKQAELNRKIKEADEELTKRKKEAEDLTRKMKEEAEEVARTEREKMVKKAREEGEEIISKAQRTKDLIRTEIIKEMELKTIDFSAQILGTVFSEKSRKVLDAQLLADFLESLDKMNLTEVAVETDTAEMITAVEVDNAVKQHLADLLKEKLKSEIKVKNTVNSQILGGAILRFGSLAVDGSLQNMIKDASVALKQKTEGL